MISSRDAANGFNSASSSSSNADSDNSSSPLASPNHSDSDIQTSSETLDAMSLELTNAQSKIKQLEMQNAKLKRELKTLQDEFRKAQSQLQKLQKPPKSEQSNKHTIERLTLELDNEKNKAELEAVRLAQKVTLINELRRKLEVKTLECQQVEKSLNKQKALMRQQQKPSLGREVFTGAMYVLGGIVIGGCIAAIIVMSGAFLVWSSPALSIVILAAILVPVVMTGLYGLNQASARCCQSAPALSVSGTTSDLQRRMPQRRRSSDDNESSQKAVNASVLLPIASQVNDPAPTGAALPSMRRSNQ